MFLYKKVRSQFHLKLERRGEECFKLLLLQGLVGKCWLGQFGLSVVLGGIFHKTTTRTFQDQHPSVQIHSELLCFSSFITLSLGREGGKEIVDTVLI